jgi:hypothetical protein
MRTSAAAREVRRWSVLLGGLAALLACVGQKAEAQEPPYFVTYSQALEEPGNLEVDMRTTGASPKGAEGFAGETVEFEYGAKAWWTTEFYLSGQSSAGDSTVFTGFRWENRVRPLAEQHWINPVLYAEYEDQNGADRSFLEVSGNDGVGDLAAKNDAARHDVEREMELKLILSSEAKGWDLSENFFTEKNMMGPDPWEFGYALGASRALAERAGARACVLCRENMVAGAELYGGLGTTNSFGLHDTSHYLGPVIGLNVPNGPSLRFSPNLGLNGNSMGVLLRASVSWEFQQFFSRFRRGEGR